MMGDWAEPAGLTAASQIPGAIGRLPRCVPAPPGGACCRLGSASRFSWSPGRCRWCGRTFRPWSCAGIRTHVRPVRGLLSGSCWQPPDAGQAACPGCRAGGYLAMGGQIIDATIVPAPRQRNSREDNAAVKAGKTPLQWKKKPAKNRQKDKDARWTKKHGKSHFGYKNHINVDRRHKLVRATPSAAPRCMTVRSWRTCSIPVAPGICEAAVKPAGSAQSPIIIAVRWAARAQNQRHSWPPCPQNANFTSESRLFEVALV